MRSTIRMIPASSSASGTGSSRPPRSTKQLAGPVDHDLGDRRVGEQRLERAEAGDLVGELAHQPLVAVGREQRVGLVQQVAEPAAQLGAAARRRGARPPPSR